MTSISKIVYIDKLDNIVKKYNNTYHSTIKMKPPGVKSSTYTAIPEPKSLRKLVKIALDLSNYSTKADLKNATNVDISKFAKKVDSANLKSDVDKLDIDKLKNVSNNFNSLKSKAN